jgi:hypothetical protein
VSNSPALVGGRSVFGFPKHVASLVLPRAPGDAALFSADTWVVDVHGGAAHDARLLEIERSDAARWQPRGARWNVPAILRVLAHLFRAGELPPRPSLDLIGQLLAPTSGMPMVFLKQLPAADGTSSAVYQAVLEADVPVTGQGQGGAIEGAWKVRTRACYSHDIARRLGLAHRRVRRGGTTWCEMDALAHGWMTFTARVQPGQLIWESVGPNARP